jgi:hypothetical protein
MGYSRFDETPPELLLEFTPEAGYRAIGTKAAARTKDRTGSTHLIAVAELLIAGRMLGRPVLPGRGCARSRRGA